VGHVTHIGKLNNAYRILVDKYEGKKRPLGKRSHKWKNNNRMYLREMDWLGMGWMHLAQDGKQWWDLVNIINIFVP